MNHRYPTHGPIPPQHGTRFPRPTGAGRPTGRPLSYVTGYGPDVLARWLNQAHEAISIRAENYWQLYQSPPYAHLWYEARDAGERLRAQALNLLYTQRPEPGGTAPDPRLPGAFSNNAIISTAARILGLHIRQLPTSADDDQRYDHLGRPLAWIQTFPQHDEAEIVCRWHNDVELRQFEIAQLIGYWARERFRLTDIDAPRGTVRLALDPPMQSLLHQFAKALLCLDHECPASWKCACNLIWDRYNALPPGHEQPTQIVDPHSLRRELRRITQAPSTPMRQTPPLATGTSKLSHHGDDNEDADTDGEASDPSIPGGRKRR